MAKQKEASSGGARRHCPDARIRFGTRIPIDRLRERERMTEAPSRFPRRANSIHLSPLSGPLGAVPPQCRSSAVLDINSVAPPPSLAAQLRLSRAAHAWGLLWFTELSPLPVRDAAPWALLSTDTWITFERRGGHHGELRREPWERRVCELAPKAAHPFLRLARAPPVMRHIGIGIDVCALYTPYSNPPGHNFPRGSARRGVRPIRFFSRSESFPLAPESIIPSLRIAAPDEVCDERSRDANRGGLALARFGRDSPQKL